VVAWRGAQLTLPSRRDHLSVPGISRGAFSGGVARGIFEAVARACRVCGCVTRRERGYWIAKIELKGESMRKLVARGRRSALGHNAAGQFVGVPDQSTGGAGQRLESLVSAVGVGRSATLVLLVIFLTAHS
jgi:hypothetical protein